MLMDPTADRARGYMLLGIIYLHAVLAFVTKREADGIAASFVQIKLLAPHVSAFFFLSGMGARQIGRRGFWQVVRQGASLVMLAILSHVTGFVLMALVHGTGQGLGGSLRLLVEPIVLGVGYSTFVAWFFLALAMARILTYLFYRSLVVFALVVVALTALVLLSQRLGLPDNMWEWRNWPAAFLFFLIGTRLPRDFAVPVPWGLAAGAGAAVLAWFNRPGVLWEGPCLACDLTFVSQPMVGGYGSIPVFLAQEALFAAFLLSMARLTRPLWITRFASYVGRNSVLFLLLNGWVILVIYPFLLPLLPWRDSPLLFVGFLLGGTVLHWALFRLLHKPLSLLLQVSFKSVDRLARLPVLVRGLYVPSGRSL